jgi:hypothetical protein
VALDLDLEGLALARRHEDVEIARIGGDALDRALLAPELAADDAHARAVVVDDFGDLRGLHVLIARRRHLQRRGQIGPQLEAVHAALRVALRHLLVHDAAPGRHPLHVAGAERTFVSEAVAVLDIAGKHIGNGLDAAVRVPGEAGKIIRRTIVAEVVEQQEGIELGSVAEAEGAVELDAGAFDGGLRLHDLLDGSDRHDGSFVRWAGTLALHIEAATWARQMTGGNVVSTG